MIKQRGAQLLDRLTMGLLAATGIMCLVYLVLLVALPGSQPSITRVPIAKLPKVLPTAPQPTLTPTHPPTPTRFPTNTPVITATFALVASPTSGPTNTPLPRFTPSKYAFTAEITLQASPYGCNWAGIAGTVSDMDYKPLTGYTIHVQGDAGIDVNVTSGTSQFKGRDNYDNSAWDVPINASGLTAGVWHIRLYKPGSNQPVSQNLEVRLNAVCGQSFAFIKFSQNH